MFRRTTRNAGGILALYLILFNSTSLAATLTAGQVDGDPGQTGLTVPVSLVTAPGQDVAGVQFDLQFDAGVFELDTVDAGEAAVAANKDVSVGFLASGTIRVVIVGFNLRVIGDGVVAYVRFNVQPDAPDGVYVLPVTNTFATDPLGNVVASDGVDGAVMIGDPPPEDVNLDGKVDATDLQLVVNGVLGMDTSFYDPDVNRDGRLDAVDVQRVVNAVMRSP